MGACSRMRRGSAIALFLSTIVLAGAVGHCAPVAEITPEGALLCNGSIRCTFSRQGGRWRMVSLSRADGRSAYVAVDAAAVSLVLYEGPEIAGDQFECVDASAHTTAADARLTATVVCPEPEIRARLTYWLTGNDPYLRKRIELTGDASLTVDELRLLDGRLASATGGGRGLPVWVGTHWWLGIEYPLGFAECSDGAVVLRHFPGRTLAEPLVSKTMVVGVAPDGRSARTGFEQYVRSIKRPSRSHLQYNSWYDLRADEMTTENLLRTATSFNENLLQPFGLRMDSFVPDDGWQAPQSIWRPREDLYPDGLAPLAAGLARMDVGLGLWMPLTGYKLDMEWAAAQGCEVAGRGRYLCLSSPNSFEAMKRATAERIRDGSLAYYKHDFNFLTCTAEGHTHLPTERHSREANLDALLRLLAWERECNPEIFLNVTSAVWLSPWWLQHADTIWMCASDFGFDRSFPQLSRREWAMSYRDAHFHDVYLRDRNPTPLSALMTHGIIKGRRNRLGGPGETLREWADYVAMYFGRGVLLKELYLTPDLLSEQQWRAVGTTARWAVENADVLERTRMFGGDPRRGEPYGFAHWRGDHGIVALRNPSHRAMRLRLPIDEERGYLGGHQESFAVRQIYPAQCRLDSLAPGADNDLTLPPASVWLIELRPEPWDEAPARPELPGRPGILRDAAKLRRMEQTVEVSAPLHGIAVEHQRLEAMVILRGDVERFGASGSLGAENLTARRADGDGWGMFAFDLLPASQEADDLRLRVTAGQPPPMFPPRAEMEVWLIGDAVAGDRTPSSSGALLPWAIGQGLRRYSVRLLPPTDVGSALRGVSATISDEQLAHIGAARLRLEVFDVNPQEAYAGKQILLNGKPIADVPANTGRLAAWQEHVIELQTEALSTLARENRVVLTNAGGDCYKFRGLTLAVQRADGEWVIAGPDEGVYSSVGAWKYAEGRTFAGDRSPEIMLTLPQAD